MECKLNYSTIEETCPRKHNPHMLPISPTINMTFNYEGLITPIIIFASPIRIHKVKSEFSEAESNN